MNISSNAHFGINAFSDTAGTTTTSTWPGTNLNSDAAWSGGGSNNFLVPLVSLNQTKSNFDDVNDALNGTATTLPLRPTGKTNIADSLNAAIAQLTDASKYRNQAKKAIILFTDGVPNEPGGSAAAAQTAAFSSASKANSKSIPIYTIGLSQNAAIKPQEDALLGDNKGGSGKGIAFLSGNNAIYVSVTKSADLNKAFQTIARSLVVLQ
jgi:hypothetical protein